MFAQSRITPERFSPSLANAFDQRDHGVLVETAIAQVRILPGTHLHQAILLGGCVDAGIRQAAQALLSLALVYDLEDFLICLKALLQKGEHDLVFIFPVMEERADMTAPVDCGPCQRHMPVALRHLSLPRWNCGKRWGCPSPFGETPYLHGV
jgi:hypothetical protein